MGTIDGEFRNKEFQNMTPQAGAEIIRSALPTLAQPIEPGEKLAVWLERAARKLRGQISVARLRCYWQRKVARPEFHEAMIILGAANAEIARQQAAIELRDTINERAQALLADRDRFASTFPDLARYLPDPVGVGDASVHQAVKS
jgi:hypothetical protein